MADRIFLIGKDEQLIALESTDFVTEDRFQQLLAEHPELLNGDGQIEADQGNWLLIAREQGVPDAEGGSSRWSLDHLFVDRDGIPTLVEVKRRSDARLRREVVAQLIEYAANATVYWPLADLRNAFQATCEAAGRSAEEVLAAFLGTEPSDEEALAQFWEQVKTNLQAGKIRMMFVADMIPAELQRIIEFLNGQMDPAEVVGLELRQYAGADIRTMVPRFVGRTAAAEARKGVSYSARQPWDEASFFTELEKNDGKVAVDRARKILNWFREKGLRIWWGKGKTMGSFVPQYITRSGTKHQLFAVWTHGGIEFYFYWYNNHSHAPFQHREKRQELAERLNQIEAIKIMDRELEKRPSFDISLMTDAELSILFEAYIWFMAELDAHDGEAS